MQVVVATDIAVPRRVVWDVITDPTRQLEFMHGLTRWEPEGPALLGTGARFRMHMRIGGIELGELIEIVEFDPPRDMAWTAVRGVGHRGRWRLRAGAPELTHVELRVTYHAMGGFFARLADLVAQPIVRSHLEQSLASLKRLLESGDAASRAS